jgi:hypothetical protein
MPPIRASRDPRTKEELLSKFLSFDYSGNIREIGEETHVKRIAPNKVRLAFPRTGKVYDLTVHQPRNEGDYAPRRKAPKIKEAQAAAPKAKSIGRAAVRRMARH